MKLPLLSSRELCVFLEKEGFILIRQKGSHRRYEHPDGRITTVPVHARDLKRGLLLAVLDDINMSREEFLQRYK